MSLEVTDDVSTEMPTSTTAPEVSATPESVAPEPKVVDSPVAAPATSPMAPAAPQAPVYQPNFKYSVRGQEKEIDEMFRALIKDQESEKKIKELFEKAEGLDFVKQDRTTLKSEYEGFKGQVTPYLQEYHKFTTLRDNGNLGAALQVAGISDEQVFEYALQRLQMSENPQLANAYKATTEQALQQFDMEGQLQRYQQMEQQLQAQQFDFNLTQAISAHRDVVSAIESKWGQPGSFKDEVVLYGIAEFNRGNHALSEQQAVEAVLNKYKPFLAPATPQAPVTPHQAPQVIPNVGGSNVSPVKPLVKSMADLRQAAREA